MATPLIKQPSESRLYTMDFRQLMTAAEAITAISSAVVTPTTLSPMNILSSAFSGKKVQIRLNGGLDGTTYVLTVIVTTDAGNTLEGDGSVKVENL